MTPKAMTHPTMTTTPTNAVVSTTTTSAAASTKSSHHQTTVVVASLQQQQQSIPTPTTTTTSTTTSNTLQNNSSHHSHYNMNHNSSYQGLALSPCRTYGVLACKDMIQLIHISSQQYTDDVDDNSNTNQLRLLKTIVVTPYFQQPPSSSSTLQPTTTTSSSYIRPSTTTTTRTSTSGSSGSSFLNLRDFALGGGAAQPQSSSSSKPRTTNTTTSGGNSSNTGIPTTTTTIPVIVTSVAWSHGDTVSSSSSSSSLPATATTDHAMTTGSSNYSNDTTTDAEEMKGKQNNEAPKVEDKRQQLLRTSMIAVAGSNGVIVVWNVASLLQGFLIPNDNDEATTTTTSTLPDNNNRRTRNQSTNYRDNNIHTKQSSSLATNNNNNVLLQQQQAIPPPTAILNHHVRQVNALAFHPTNQSLLLSASQDCTVLVWERRKRQLQSPKPSPSQRTTTTTNSPTNPNRLQLRPQPQQQQQQSSVYGLKGLFGGAFSGGINQPSPLQQQQQQQQRQRIQPQQQEQQQQEQQVLHHHTWRCRTTFTPKSEAIRDVQWSPMFPDVFAVVTGSGSLLVYNQYITARVIIRISAHSGDASSLHWHPTRCNVIATGGDRSVKIWDFEREFEREFNSSSNHSTNRDDSMTHMERNASTVSSRGESIGTNESSTVVGTDTFSPYGTIGASSMTYGMSSLTYGAKTFSSTSSVGNANTSHHRKRNLAPLHILSISAAVTRIRWRPVANSSRSHGIDRHDSMISVATAPIKGTNAGGAGTLSLWSFHRPFMPLCVVEGHQDGAVADFDWLETPQQSSTFSSRLGETTIDRDQTVTSNGIDSFLYNNSVERVDDDCHSRIWQHVISVGRDGNCFVQSLVRGDRPISRVPPSCFAMANLSPFQKGYGSLQIFSVCQPVPSGPILDETLTGLRRDRVTASAPGIFRELPLDDNDTVKSKSYSDKTNISSNVSWKFGTRIPEESPEIHFNVVDQGDLDDTANPIDDPFDDDNDRSREIVVAPEVVHLSRYAERYKLYVDSDCPTRRALCQHNAGVAESLSQYEIANMWRMTALMLESCLLNDNSCTTAGVTDTSVDKNDDVAAEDGLFLSSSNEMVRHVLLPFLTKLLEERADGGDVQTCVAICEIFGMVRSDESVLIAALEIEYIREWYLSYIDLLRDMCLFSYATYVIKRCRDPVINALNQQSTTIHESCPHCGKAMLPDESSSSSSSGRADSTVTNARRICKSCRRRVGLCFLCHEPVKGVFVWCPGCGHGGHLEHALQWFGGGGNGVVRTMCPTGCGHQCNLTRLVSAFPRTESFS